MTMKYRTVNTSTLKGLKEAERLKAYGWKIERVGFWTILFSKSKKMSDSKKRSE